MSLNEYYLLYTFINSNDTTNIYKVLNLCQGLKLKERRKKRRGRGKERGRQRNMFITELMRVDLPLCKQEEFLPQMRPNRSDLI